MAPNEKKKGFSVSLKSLKHFDCKEKQDLMERAVKSTFYSVENVLCIVRLVLWEWFCCCEGRSLGVDFHWG